MVWYRSMDPGDGGWSARSLVSRNTVTKPGTVWPTVAVGQSEFFNTKTIPNALRSLSPIWLAP